MPFFSRALLLRFCLLILTALLFLSGCAAKRQEDTAKYRGDVEEMMSLYTPRDDGLPLTDNELHAFKTLGDLDRHLSEEDARIVELHFKFFVHQRRGTFERFLERSARFLPHIKKTFVARGIPEDIAYLCMVESGGNPNARSHAGAAGLWQFIPSTGRRYGLRQNNWLDERRDPYKATFAASDYLLKLYSDFGNWHLAVAAYNAGEGKIGRAVSGTGAKDFFELCRLDGGLEERARLKDETRDYVPRLIAMAKIMRNLDRLGFKRPGADVAWNLAPVSVPPGTNLIALAQKAGLSWEEFSGMNPAYRRTTSPPNQESTAYLPPDKVADATAFLASSAAKGTAAGRDYTIKRGDTVTSIARRHSVSVAALKEANGFDQLPPIGSLIIVPGKGPSFSEGGGVSGSSYTVRAGDTLSGLAQRWGTTASAIRAENGMGAKETALRQGQRLVVPGSAKKSPVPAAKPAQAASVRSGVSPDSARPGVASQHIVQPGDTVFGIARGYGITAKALCEANNLNLTKPIIRPGQKLTVPGAGAVQSAPAPARQAPAPATRAPDSPQAAETLQAKGGMVTVRQGDTLSSIARANGVSVSALQKANNLGTSTKLKIGQKLRLP